MRCESCDTGLTDYESSLKLGSGEYVNMCKKCLTGLNIPVTGNYLLLRGKKDIEHPDDQINEFLSLDHLVDEEEDE